MEVWACSLCGLAYFLFHFLITVLKILQMHIYIYVCIYILDRLEIKNKINWPFITDHLRIIYLFIYLYSDFSLDLFPM